MHYEQYVAKTRNTQRHVAECEITEERRQQAQRAADDALKQCLLGHVLPQQIEHFLRRIWCAHVQQVALLNGDNGPALKAVLALGEALLVQWRQASEGRIPERPWLYEERAGILEAFCIAGMTLVEAEAGLCRFAACVGGGYAQSSVIATSTQTQSFDTFISVPDTSATSELNTASPSYFRELPWGPG